MTEAIDSSGLRPQAERLLEHIKTISEQYGDDLGATCPELAAALCDCATELSHYLANAGGATRQPTPC